MNIGDLALTLQAPLAATLRGLYTLARVDPTVAFMTRLTPGCTAAEIAHAETRIGYPLPPLHQSVLTFSNGGSLPYVHSLEYLAAAIPREAVWRVLGPVPGDTLNEQEPGYQPRPPLLLGEPLERALAGVGIDPGRFPASDLGPDVFIVMGQGYFDVDGFYCYHREDPGPIYAVGMPDHGVYVVACDFDAFIRSQQLISDCEDPAFLTRMQAALRAME